MNQRLRAVVSRRWKTFRVTAEQSFLQAEFLSA